MPRRELNGIRVGDTIWFHPYTEMELHPTVGYSLLEGWKDRKAKVSCTVEGIIKDKKRMPFLLIPNHKSVEDIYDLDLAYRSDGRIPAPGILNDKAFAHFAGDYMIHAGDKEEAMSSLMDYNIYGADEDLDLYDLMEYCLNTIIAEEEQVSIKDPVKKQDIWNELDRLRQQVGSG